jgi:hypothetical protein
MNQPITTEHNTTQHESEDKCDSRIEFSVDGEDFTTNERRLTAAQILQLAGLDPATHYLTLVRGKKQQRLANDEVVEMHDGLRFVSASTEPTPTS